MKILRYHHNKLVHKAVLHHGLFLSLQTDMGVVDVLSLPIAERNYIEGQSGKYLKAPADMYPLASPLGESEVFALGKLAATVKGDNLLGSGAKVLLETANASAQAVPCEILSTDGTVAGYCILINWFDEKTEPIATSLGPWITTMDELSEMRGIDLKITVNGKPGNLRNLKVGDVIAVDAGLLGLLSAELVSA